MMKEMQQQTKKITKLNNLKLNKNAAIKFKKMKQIYNNNRSSNMNRIKKQQQKNNF